MKVIILFGEMGSGKSYLGKKLADKLNYLFIEGDAFASDEMGAAIAGLKRINNKMIDDLIFDLDAAVRLVAELEPELKGVVVSQALYQEHHRETLMKSWRDIGYAVECGWVRTPMLQHIRQLVSRPKGWRWVVYWLLSKPFFQRPTHPHTVLMNAC